MLSRFVERRSLARNRLNSLKYLFVREETIHLIFTLTAVSIVINYQEAILPEQNSQMQVSQLGLACFS